MAGGWGCGKHTVHGLVEFDVTQARETIRQHKAQTGETLSFTAFILACLGKAMEMNKHMHAYRNWRSQLIIFDEVDVNTLFEVEVDGKKTIRPHILRGVNKKTFSGTPPGNPRLPTGTQEQSRIEVHRLVCPAARHLSGDHSYGSCLRNRS